jgi:RimJ/RimL family protein N-acetyltransferase
MQKDSLPLTFRLTNQEDAPFLLQWLSDPKVLRWFPMCDAREIEDSVRIWVGYSRIEAGVTALWEGVPCGMANLYIQPYKKQAHTCLFAIIVKEEMRGKGVGKGLLEHLMKYAKQRFKIEVLHLEVYEGNPAKRLYERLGFKEFGRQSRFIKEEGKYTAKIFMQRE